MNDDFAKRFNLSTEDLAIYYEVLNKNYGQFRYINHVVMGNYLVIHFSHCSLTTVVFDEILVETIDRIKARIDEFKKDKEFLNEKNKVSEINQLKYDARLI